ncbi:hypothetical protein A8990_109167 [Paenibacillus taihuensis]|uniref:Uncharacterized protein n=1 Tax=Paenibacillus taihuensis TaxID=1156355 RepID=A0A3D9SCL3_9BACL|nr:hypothetical protein A8990_109167 [Paenibacillus taihuensis]
MGVFPPFFAGFGRKADQGYALGTEGPPPEVQYEKPPPVRFEEFRKSLL